MGDRAVGIVRVINLEVRVCRVEEVGVDWRDGASVGTVAAVTAAEVTRAVFEDSEEERV